MLLFLIAGGSSETEWGRGEDYVAIAGYCGEHQDDISFPEGTTLKVLEKNSTGWWVVRQVFKTPLQKKTNAE